MDYLWENYFIVRLDFKGLFSQDDWSYKMVQWLWREWNQLTVVRLCRGRKFTGWIEDKRLGLHQNGIFQHIWVNSLGPIQLVSEWSTMRTNRSVLIKRTQGAGCINDVWAQQSWVRFSSQSTKTCKGRLWRENLPNILITPCVFKFDKVKRSIYFSSWCLSFKFTSFVFFLCSCVHWYI